MFAEHHSVSREEVSTHTTKTASLTHVRRHNELYDQLCETSGGLLTGGLIRLAQELPFPRSSSCRRVAGRSAIRARTSASRALGSTSLRRQVLIIVSMMAARSAPRWLPAKVQLRFQRRCLSIRAQRNFGQADPATAKSSSA